MVPTFLTGQYTLHKSFDSPADSHTEFPASRSGVFLSGGETIRRFRRTDISITIDNISPFGILSSHFASIFIKKGIFYFFTAPKRTFPDFLKRIKPSEKALFVHTGNLIVFLKRGDGCF